MSGMPPETFAPAPVPPIPWEQPGAPMPKALFETIGLFLSKPGEAYRRMPTTPSIGRPIVYYLLIGWIATAVAEIYSLALQNVLPMPSFWQERMDQLGFGPPTVLQTVIGIVLAPIVLVIGLFIWTAIVHFFLFVLGGANAGFLTTCRVVCYAGSANVMNLVPFCGRVIAPIWGIVLQIIGVKEAHRTTTAKACLAVLLPLFLCCTCVVICVVFLSATIMSLLQGGQ